MGALGNGGSMRLIFFFLYVKRIMELIKFLVLKTMRIYLIIRQKSYSFNFNPFVVPC